MKTLQELKEEFDEPIRKQKYISCSDRMCGADDCPNCRPENFHDGIFIDDIKNDE